MPRSTRRRHYMSISNRSPRTSSHFAPLDFQALPTFDSFPPPLAPLAVNHAIPPPSPGAGIVPLVAKCLTQLSGGLIITAATISSLAAVPALQRLDSRRPAGHPAPHCTCDPVRLAPPSRDLLPGHCAALAVTPIVAALASAEPPGGARSLSSCVPVAAAPASAGPPGGAR